MSSVSELIKKIAGGKQPCLNGVVKSVDKQEMTCEVGFGDEDSIVASLVVGDKKRGIVQIPKLGSNVLVLFQGLSVGFVLIVDEVEEIVINGGENGGLVKVEELKEWMQNVESDLISLKTLLSAHFVAGNGAPLGLVFEPSVKSSEIEDKTIKH